MEKEFVDNSHMRKTVRVNSNVLIGLRNFDKVKQFFCQGDTSTNIKSVFAFCAMNNCVKSNTGLGLQKPSPSFSVTYGIRGLISPPANAGLFPLMNVS